MSIRNACEMASHTDAGCLRTLNEDAVRTVPDSGLLVVADGMGGHNAGDMAARVAVEAIEEQVRAALAQWSCAGRPVREGLHEALAEADLRICRAGEADRLREQMGATVACVLLHDDRAWVAHVGDARVYRLHGSRLALLTRDHSPAQRALASGMVDAAGLAGSHNRHLVTHALGAGGAEAIEIRESMAEPGDVFLVCSDGLNDMVDGIDIELVLDTMRDNLPLAASQLVMIARDCGGHDNISVALVRIDSPFPAPRRSSTPSRVSFLARLRAWFAGVA